MNLRQISTDLQRRYEKSYVFIQFPDGDRSLFFVDQIRNDDNRVARITCRSPDYGILSINHGSAHRIQFRFPKSQVFQHEKQAILFKRTPRKQYRRGICTDNCLVMPTYGKVCPAWSCPMDHASLSSAFEGKKHSYVEALLFLKEKGYASVALEKNFSLSLLPFSTGVKGFGLFWWDVLVAKVDEHGKLLTVFHKALDAEINQAVSQG